MMKNILFGILFLCVGLSEAFAVFDNKIELVIISNTEDDSVSQLSLITTERNEAEGILLESEWDDRSRCERTPDEGVYYGKEMLLNPNGVPLLICEGREIVRLKVKELREDAYDIDMEYLKNGLFNVYKQCKFDLERKEDNWVLRFQKTGAEATSLRLKISLLGVSTVHKDCN